MTEAEILASIVKRIEAVRDEKKLLAGSERDLFTEAKDKHIDGKALRRVLQRRAMDDADREAFDDLVDQYEQALAGKAVAAAALKAGATVREAAKAGGVSASTAQRTKNRVSGTDRAATSSAPEAASGKGDPAAADPIDPSTAGGHLSPHAGNDTAIPSAPKSPVVETPSPSGVEPQLAGTSGFPATPSPSVDSVPVGEPDPDDSDWERRDGAATYDGVRQIQRDTLVASGAARLHPAEIDMPEIPDWLRRA